MIKHNNENYPDERHPTSSDSVRKRAVTNNGDWKGKSMKVRKLAIALALAGGLGSGVAQALGLGEIELQSYLNEPLDAEIALPQSHGVDPGDIFVNIAPESAYARVGLNRNLFLSKLRFKVVTESDGSLRVNVSSKEPLREPYLNFLLELTWPNGRLMREYAVLVDPPVYAEKAGVRDNVRAPAASSSDTPQRSLTSATPRRSPQASQPQSRRYQGNTFGPTGPSDTLWEIASQVRPGDDVSMQQVMLAIQDLNPSAFIDGNINRLKRGEVLRIPSIDQMQSRTRAEATRVVGLQNRDFQSPKRTIDATGTLSKPGTATPATSGGDELKLLVADSDAKEPTDGGSAGGDGQQEGGVDAGAAVAMEELESARRENSELTNRVDDLQDQVQTLQRLLELKNNQLADLQKVVGDTEPAQIAAADITATDITAADSVPATAAVEDTESTEASEGTRQEASAESTASGAEVPAIAESELPETGEAKKPEVVEESAIAVPPAAEKAEVVQPAPKPAPDEPVVADKGFPANVIDAITNNPIYQFALGGGLILLLLLLLVLARRNANREKAFYEQLNSEPDEGADSFDLNLEDDEESEQEGEHDVLAEADAYIAYGRHDQAAQALEMAISREPSRTDLRLKLLGVYADNQDRTSFERQFGEIEALDDEEALATANELRSELDEAESIPSIDDLESQLRSDSFGIHASEDTDEIAESDVSDFESDLANFNLNDDDESLLDEEDDSESDDKDDLIEYDLSGIAVGSDDETTLDEITEAEADLEVGFEDVELESVDDGIEDLSLDLDDDKPEEGELTEDELEEDVLDSLSGISPEDGIEGEDAEDITGDGIGSLDETFLDELDAELDKVANEEEDLFDGGLEESSLDDLELDVSDEDLALMEEFSESAEATDQNDPDSLSLDEELDLEDALREVEEDAVPMDDLPVASDEVSPEAPTRGITDIDESDLGDDDDFDFLAGTDEAATKLDLARAYIEMGDSDGARDILEEVALEGNEEQKAEAQDLLKNMS
jgi:pilus assembly protein FimV